MDVPVVVHWWCVAAFCFVVRSRIARDFHNRRRRHPMKLMFRERILILRQILICALLSSFSFLHCCQHARSIWFKQSLLVGLVTEILYQMLGITVSLECGVMRTSNMFFCGRSSDGTVCVARRMMGTSEERFRRCCGSLFLLRGRKLCVISKLNRGIVINSCVANGRRFCRSSWSCGGVSLCYSHQHECCGDAQTILRVVVETRRFFLLFG